MAIEFFIPFYGSFEHLKVAVTSVLKQTDPDWKLTVIDDAYPDLAPGNWVQDIRDSRIRYIRNEENLKPSKNYNKSLGLASEDYIVFLGCDDELSPEFVMKVKSLIGLYPGAEIIQPGVSVIDNKGRNIRPLVDRVKAFYRLGGIGARVFSGEVLATSLMKGNWTYFPSLVWKRDTLNNFGFRLDLDVVQDLAAIMEIVLNGGKLVLDDTSVFFYRRHSASFSSVSGPNGIKFIQERILFSEIAMKCRKIGWIKAGRASRWYMSSRLHSLAELPLAILAKNSKGVRTIARHAFGKVSG
jgi:glycosyltransferase involved in cell wall biosynthesis